jgi:hypothetical protein
MAETIGGNDDYYVAIPTSSSTTTFGSPANISIAPRQNYIHVGGPWKTYTTAVPHPYLQPQPVPYVHTSQEPTEGMLANIQDKLYRYSEVTNQWIEVVDADEAQLAEAPKIRVELDASLMLKALQEYKTFLEELDGLENGTGEVVDDVVWGLRETIEALERLKLPNG